MYFQLSLTPLCFLGHKKERNVNLKCSSRRKRNVIKGLKTTSICKLRNARTNGTWTAGLWTRPGHAHRGPSETVSTWDTVKEGQKGLWSKWIVSCDTSGPNRRALPGGCKGGSGKSIDSQ